MPRRRSQTGFTGILPPELVERCLEFLPFEEVHTNAMGSGLESWAEPSDMASFIFWLREWDSDEIHRLSDIALALSRNWQDRQKAGAFVAAAVFFVARLRSDLDEESAA